MADSGLLTIAEASTILRLRPSTLRAWVLRRKIPYVKVGRLVRLRRADVETLIDASVVPARPAAAEANFTREETKRNEYQNRDRAESPSQPA